MKIGSGFSNFARWAAWLAGHPASFAVAVCVLLIWAVTGPFFQYSDTWQLVINTSTSVVTFLMVFLIQNSQNRDTIAIHLKLDELIRSIKEAHNSVMDLENMDEAELRSLLAQYQKLAGFDATSRIDAGAGEPPIPRMLATISDPISPDTL